MVIGPFFLANPLGLWALLGIPALVLIHFFQQRLKRIPVSTGFLLDHIHLQSPQGSRFQRFYSSWPFWLQLLCVLILALLLCGLSWRSERPLRSVAIVLDGSASMIVSQDRAMKAIEEFLQPLEVSNRLDLTLSTSDASRQLLYRGNSVADAATRLTNWLPQASTHDPADALRTARALVREEGTVLFLTDQAPQNPLPYAAQAVAVGEVIANVGITSVKFERTDEQTRFIALVHNFGDTPVNRSWQLSFPEFSHLNTKPQSLSIPAAATMRLEGVIPAGTRRALVSLEQDEFPFDDQAPLFLPKAKTLRVALSESLDQGAVKYWQRLLAALDGIEQVREEPDVLITSARPAGNFALPYLLHLPEAKPESKLRVEAITSAGTDLMEGLQWQGLSPRVRSSEQNPQEQLHTPINQTQALLWQGETSLAWLEQHGRERALVLNLHPFSARAHRDPSLLVLCARFLESIRERLPRPELVLTETQTLLRPALPAEWFEPEAKKKLSWRVVSPSGVENVEKEVSLSPLEASGLMAPSLASWFSLREAGKEGQEWLAGAALFADTREMNFAQAASMSEFDPAQANELAQQDTAVDEQRRSLWILAILFLLLTSWFFLSAKTGSKEFGEANAGDKKLKIVK